MLLLSMLLLLRLRPIRVSLSCSNDSSIPFSRSDAKLKRFFDSADFKGGLLVAIVVAAASVDKASRLTERVEDVFCSDFALRLLSSGAVSVSEATDPRFFSDEEAVSLFALTALRPSEDEAAVGCWEEEDVRL